MLLLRSESPITTKLSLGLVFFCLLASLVLLLLPSSPQQLQPQQAILLSTQQHSIVPSGAPIVPPPFTPSPVSVVSTPPVVLPQQERRGRRVPIQEEHSAPKFLPPQQDANAKEQLDMANRPLPACTLSGEEENGHFGSFPARNYASVERECLVRMSDADADFACQPLLAGNLAASYNSEDGKLCKCGGIPQTNQVCLVTTSVRYEYTKHFSIGTTAEGKPLCESGKEVDWNLGSFNHGRYSLANCSLLDINPQSLTRYFPNQFILFDGDSHQEDNFWGFVSEVRNTRYYAIPTLEGVMGKSRQFGKDVRFEVSAQGDHLELFDYGTLDLGRDANIRKCSKTRAQVCTVFVYRFDRMPLDFQRTLQSLRDNPPDVLIAGFVSKTYSHAEDRQMETKRGWEDIFASSRRPIKVAWTSFPMNSGFIVQDMSHWTNTELSRHAQVVKHFPLVESKFWDALQHNSPKTEPGFFTLQLTWHSSCHMSIDTVTASEACQGPVPRLMYAAMLSLMI